MNRASFRTAISLIVGYLIAVVAGGFWLKSKQRPEYEVYKDMIPVMIAIAAAVLTGCVQRRIAFLTEVRKLYDQCVKAFESALQYTHLEKAGQSEFAAVYKELACAVELFRGSFRNAGDSGGRQGLYPFEALKSILQWHSYLGFGTAFRVSERTSRARKAMTILWQDHLRPPVLAELDRWRPRFFASHYWNYGRGKDWPLPPANPS
ncbi:hypothetical protein [Bradyrhizobium sp. Leo170]|uniref:hypothetical protein n=1 Tax=Bradyrhizobium sp. Leo170 TaxID=1571199 RepID=UPI0013EEDAD4|nr:hypothetical protein [Bradyrhizobium sp. Leo170]